MKETLIRFPKTTSGLIPAVDRNQCHRCLSKKIGIDVDNRLFCQECLASEDMYLLRKMRSVKSTNHKLESGFVLSSQQQSGSRFMLELVETGKSGVIMAVCGSGKTEMTLEAIHWALNRNWRVCFAAPRVAIVVQLASRLQGYFPETAVKAIYGNSKDDTGIHLIVATINQLVNYYHEFDLIILDEADAFPYVTDSRLQRFVTKAMKLEGVLVRMSATMTQKANERDPFLVISKRHHGMALPMPKFCQTENLDRMISHGRLPQEFTWQLEKWQEKDLRVLVYVPRIRHVRLVHDLLVKTGYACGFVSSRNKHPEAVVNDFMNKKTTVLVATTILERGVTFPDVQVAVLMADNDIFDASTLIQISGRVGRYKEKPTGDIVLFSEYRTKAMLMVKKYVKKMNKEAKRQG